MLCQDVTGSLADKRTSVQELGFTRLVHRILMLTQWQQRKLLWSDAQSLMSLPVDMQIADCASGILLVAS